MGPEETEGAGSLGGERAAAAVEAVPDDRHRVPSRAVDDVLLVDREPAELESVVGRVTEGMEGVGQETEAGRVAVGKAGEHDGRLAIGNDKKLHEPAIRGIRDEHLRAIDDEPAIPPGQRRPHRSEVASHLRLGGTKHRQRPSRRQAGQVTGLLRRCPEGDQRRHRPDRGVDGEHPCRGGHDAGDPRHALHQVDDRPPATAVGNRNMHAPQPRLPHGGLGGRGEQPLLPRRRVVERGRRQLCRLSRGIKQALGAERAQPPLCFFEDPGDVVRERLRGEGGGVGKPTVIPARKPPQRRGDAGGGAGLERGVTAGHDGHARGRGGGGSGVERGREVVGDRGALQFHGVGHLPAVDVERAVDEHDAMHSPGTGERRLPSGEPAGQKAQKTRMTESRPSRRDANAE